MAAQNHTTKNEAVRPTCVLYIPCFYVCSCTISYNQLNTMQVLTAEVELSDTPKIQKLTLKHIQGPLVLLAVSLGVATIIWLGQICHSRALQKMGGKPSRTSRKNKKRPNINRIQVVPKPKTRLDEIHEAEERIHSIQ